MCGIIAYTGKRQALPILIDGLKRLEYRGYDSAGVAVHQRKKLKVYKAAGKIVALEAKLPQTLSAQCGIGHTRWATHGAPTEENAHPHVNTSGTLALVHNGIIENVEAFKPQLLERGVEFVSETDTEVLVHQLAFITEQRSIGLPEAMRLMANQLVGTFGIAVTDVGNPSEIVLARNGSPVIIGIGDEEMLAASDMAALSRHTRDIVHLDDREVAVLSPQGFEVTAFDASSRKKSPVRLEGNVEDYDKGGYDHYLYKEIVEQPQSVQKTLGGRLDRQFSTARLGGLNLQPRDLLATKRVKILGCGSALYAGMAGAQMIEALSRIPADAEAAAEFRYRNPVIEADTLYMVVSQSGETFDTLAATREIQRKGGFVLGIVNSVGSTIAREVNGGIYMHAGPEVSVASTKAYSAMLTVFMLFALLLGRTRDISPQHGTQILDALERIPDNINDVLALEPQIVQIARKYSDAQSAFFVGRTSGWPVALEGAQKLKEISYIHAEAYAASELKHGPLALVTEHTPCVVLLPNDNLLSKSLGSLEEIRARSAPVIAVTDADNKRIDELATDVIRTPATHPLAQGLISGVALQLYAYHSAVALQRDVDQPRHLAKSVTVE